MWYAVETAFINGEHYMSKPCFTGEKDGHGFEPGTCDRLLTDEPMNSCQTFMGGLIEIRTDWFQTREQALAFVRGSMTYKITRRQYYRADIKSTLSDFMKWEAIEVKRDILPWRGITEIIQA